MSSQNQVTVRDLLEEAKKRVLFLVICIVGLSYLMSLTSSSVWVNLPAAAFLIILIRYFSLDFETRRKAATYVRRPLPENNISHEKPLEYPKVVKSDWRRKVNSRVAEDAIDHFTRHLISEWVTDLWYSRLTPDKEGPEELINIVNGVLGEIAGRFRNINLIDLLMRDLINLICTHMEHFRSTKGKIEKQQLGTVTIEQLDTELRRLLAMENRLHPALFSSEAQHKVLQHMMNGLISFTFKHEDLQCLYFRFTARELLASAVMRPVLNLASPRFINERIESFVINMTKPKKVESLHENLESKPDGSPRVSSDNFSKFLDPSIAGVELVQLKNVPSTTPADLPAKVNLNATLSKDPLLSIDTRSSRSWKAVPLTSQNVNESAIQKHSSGGEWGEKLDQFSRRKVKALAPENFENMWAKGRDYKMKEDENQLNKNVQQGLFQGKPVSVSGNHERRISNTIDKESVDKLNCSKNNTVHLVGCTDQLTVDGSSYPAGSNILNGTTIMHYQDNDRDVMHLNDFESERYTSDDEETSNVTGLDSPGTKVWNARNNRNIGISHIHHPLENFDGSRVRKTGKGNGHHHRLSRNQSARKRSRHNSQKVPVWQEVERTSFISGDGQDILKSSKGLENDEDSGDDSEMESSGRIHSGEAASSSVPSISHILPSDPSQSSLMVDSFFRLKCEVMGANIVKSGSRTFAVYSISVTDVNSNNSWSIKRRFRHFEELHRRLKEFSEYNLHLPPKQFLSTGLDVPIIQERCKLLDKYLKRLIQLPKISGSIEVWDFLSVDSQTYVFSNSFSIIETLSVDLEDKPHEDNKSVSNPNSPVSGLLPLRRDHAIAESLDPKLQAKSKYQANGLRLNTKDAISMEKSGLCNRKCGKTENEKEDGTLSDGKTESQKENERSGEGSEFLVDAATDPMLPTEWVPPNLTVPIFDLVDVIFQLQDGGWIRRKAFWVAKQVLQLGMGDALDDWLIEKIQRLRKGSAMASAVTRLEQILWPDGVFISKRPRQPLTPESSPSPLSPRSLGELQQQEADRRAKFVYDLMITNAPSAIVGLFGRKEYEQCAKDLYYFLQSAVCMKLLALDLIELLLLTLFPELDYVFKQLHEEKEKFGKIDLHE